MSRRDLWPEDETVADLADAFDKEADIADRYGLVCFHRNGVAKFIWLPRSGVAGHEALAVLDPDEDRRVAGERRRQVGGHVLLPELESEASRAAAREVENALLEKFGVTPKELRRRVDEKHALDSQSCGGPKGPANAGVSEGCDAIVMERSGSRDAR